MLTRLTSLVLLPLGMHCFACLSAKCAYHLVWAYLLLQVCYGNLACLLDYIALLGDIILWLLSTMDACLGIQLLPVADYLIVHACSIVLLTSLTIIITRKVLLPVLLSLSLVLVFVPLTSLAPCVLDDLPPCWVYIT